jgi:transcription antitermination factor NusG
VPILSVEPDRYPLELFDPGASDVWSTTDRAWFVLHTRPRQEKSLARYLRAAGVSYYLPTVPRRCRTRGRVLTANSPLFPGYLFFYGDGGERLAALESNRVVHSLPVIDQSQLWDDLRQINQMLGTGLPISAESRFAPGTPVEITTGPLAGLCGTVIRTGSGRRFVVRVNFIHQGASVLLEDCALLPLRGAGLVS